MGADLNFFVKINQIFSAHLNTLIQVTLKSMIHLTPPVIFAPQLLSIHFDNHQNLLLINRSH
jgi:hypothetical protein